jgi:hypothetical protein
MRTEFCCESQKERDHLEDLDVEGSKRLKLTLEKYNRCIMVWFNLDPDGNQRWAVVNTVMNLWD